MRGNDPAIRLFGQKIALPAGGGSLAADDQKDSSTREVTEATVDDELVGQETTPECNDNPKTPPIDEDSSKSRSSKAENEQSDAANSQEKPLKKPDKILPCPRCNSMDTKFCYYNNYNVSQPRHFCKACQRYWTAGGTMRNVPVGAGRRKNKNPASHYRHITISEALQAARVDLPSSTSHPALNVNGRVLNFGLEAPVCEPVASILNLPDTKTLNRAQNGFHRIKVAENADDHSSLVTGPSSLEGGGINHHPLEPLARGINGFAPPITCVPGLPWPYPWNSAVAPPTTFFPPGYPMPFFPPAANWNCGMPGGWNIPMLSPQSSTSSNQKEHCPTPNSSNLGKHSRDKDDAAPKHKNGCVLVPKILRIDDPDEAAKSSIWTTLGIIKNESFSREGFFKAIQPKGDGKNRPAEASYAMRANPAALSRSIGFHESS